MKMIPSLAVLFTLAVLGQGTACLAAAEADGVALAIIYDTSGSMRDPVPAQLGGTSPKYLVANRALIAVANQIEAFATNNAGGAPRRIDAGLFVFRGDTARPAIKFGPFEGATFRNWARHFSDPNGNTPLGNALTLAGQAVLESPLPRKHVLIITDGMNTAGPKPEDVLPVLQRKALGRETSVSVHFIAFDTDAKVFAPVKKLGATVVGAADEQQLNTQLGYILQRKILLEEEEKK
jgi:hypothetical protein